MRSWDVVFVAAAGLALASGIFTGCAESAHVGVTGAGADAEPPAPEGADPPEAGVDSATDREPDAGPPHCSGDLRFVLDGDNHVLNECSASEGCLDAKCVSACDAAAGAHGSSGCDFVVTTPSMRILPPCHAVGITNASRGLMQVEVSRDGTTFDTGTTGRIARPGGDNSGAPPLSYITPPSYGIPPGETLVVFLSGDPASRVRDGNGRYYDHASMATVSADCPFPKAVNGSTAVYVPLATPDVENDRYVSDDATGRGKAFRVRTNVPATLVDVAPWNWHPNQQAGKATLLPVSTWGTKYVTIAPNAIPSDNPVAFPTPGEFRPNFTQVVAASDGTTVTVTPKSADLPGGPGVNAARHGVTTSYTLAAGEFIQWQGVFDMTGSIIESDKPIGVVVGSPFSGYEASIAEEGTHYEGVGLQRARATSGAYATHAPLLPVSELGSEYVGAHFEYAMNAPVMAGYRIVAAASGTKLSFDPPPASVTKTTLDAGDSLSFAFVGAFSVKSQDAAHPFLVAQLGGGCWYTNGGDEFDNCQGGGGYLRPLPPADRWLTRAVARDLHRHAISHTVFVRRRTPDGVLTPMDAVYRDGTRIALRCGDGLLGTFEQPVGGFTDLVWAKCAVEGIDDTKIVAFESAAPFTLSSFVNGDYFGGSITWGSAFGPKNAVFGVPVAVPPSSRPSEIPK